MNEAVLKAFLIRLGFRIDDAGLKRFTGSLTLTEKIVKDFALAVGAMAVAVEEAVRRTSNQFATLFYLSQQTGVAIRGLKEAQFAFEQIGMSAQDANNTLTGIATAIRNNPGLRGLANSLVPGWHDAKDILNGLTLQYRQLMDRFGETGPAIDAASIGIRRYSELLGIPAEQLRQGALNWKAFQAAQEQASRSLNAFGFNNLQKAGEKAAELQRQLGRIWLDIGIAFDRFITDSFPTLEKLFKGLADWMEGEGSKKVRAWADSFQEWVNNKDNIESIKNTFVAIGGVILVMAHGIDSVIQGIKALNSELGATGTLIAVIAGAILTKAALTALTRGAVGLITKGLGLGAGLLGLGGGTAAAGIAGAGVGAAGTGGVVGMAGGVLGGAAAVGAAALFAPDSILPKEAVDARKSAFQSLLQWIHKSITGRDDLKFENSGSPDTVLPAPGSGPIPGAHKSAFMGGGIGGDTSDALLHLFGQWWSGSSAFRPIVALADDFYDRMRDLFEMFFKPLAGTAGGGPGEEKGSDGTAAGRRMPGPLGGMGPRIGEDGKPTPRDGTTPEGRWWTGKAGPRQAEHGGFNFAGIRADQQGNFRTYPDEFSGVADAGDLLRSYGRRGFNTLNSILNRWAPASDNNNTAQLIQRASQWTGWKPDQVLNTEDPETLTKLLNSMNRNEFGGKETVPQERLGGYVKRLLGGEKPKQVEPQTANKTLASLGPGSGGKFSGGRVNLGHVNEALVKTISAAAGMLPEGFTVKATSGERTGGLANSQHHGGNALDIEIVGPDGKALPNRGQAAIGTYAAFAHKWYQQVVKQYPQLAKRAAWGGQFETSPGSGVADPMHFDFGGPRGHIPTPNWRYIDSDHNTTVNVYGSGDPQATAKAVSDTQRRQSALHIRNLRTAIV